MAHEQRRLAAILVADVVGYSKLVGNDEAGTLAKLRTLRSEIVEASIAKHSGRLFKAVGDGFLVEFASAVQAVTAARAVQQANAGGSLQLRIGVHLGDVVVQGDDLMGDGVNIAARLEGVAEPGGIAISRQVRDQVRDKLDVELVDKGEVELKNIARPVRVFLVAGTKAAMQPQVLVLPDRPSIAVLPFLNMSGDPEQEYFADGVAEDILTGLSRYRWLFVIARNSSFAYKGRTVDVRQVGRELGVRYVLEGSVRKLAGRVRFTAQLVEAASATHVWADRYEAPVGELFELQDRITETVVAILEPTIHQSEIERLRRRRPDSLGAYDYYLRALSLTHLLTPESVRGMMAEARRAIELDPSFAPAYALAARACVQRMIQGWGVDEAAEAAEALDLAERGLLADRSDAMMLSTAGHCFAWFAHDYGRGIAHIDEAIALNPNHAHGFLLSGIVRTRSGDIATALMHLERARRLSPLDSRNYANFQMTAFAHFLAGDRDVAVAWARRAVQHNRNYLMAWNGLAFIAASLRLHAEARDAVGRVMEIDPAFSISAFIQRYRVLAAEPYYAVVDAMRLAGFPE